MIEPRIEVNFATKMNDHFHWSYIYVLSPQKTDSKFGCFKTLVKVTNKITVQYFLIFF